MGHKDNCTIDWIAEFSTELDQIKLRQLFNYDSKTGKLISKKRKKPVGCLDKSTGYIRYKYDGKNLRVHRLIWVWLHGAIPDGFIVDHVDNDRTNNRERNLRLATGQENSQNIKEGNKNNQIGIRGVSKRGDLYQARITHNRKTIVLGLFPTAEMAGREYFKQKELLHSGYSK